MIEQSPLERRYRRMLIWYPAEHRATYGEELIGVLLASTPEGRDRPGPARAFDLIWAGLRIRFRATGRRLANVSWPDALAVLSVAIPVILVASLVTEWAYDLHSYAGHWYVQVYEGLLALAVVLPVAVALRYRRLGALIAFGLAATVLASSVGSVISGTVLIVYGEAISVFLALLLMAAALVLSPGPRHGARILGRSAWLVLAGSGVAMVLIQQHILGRSALLAAVLILVALAVFAAGILATIPGPIARGVLLFLAVPAYPGAVWAFGYSAPFADNLAAFPNVAFLPSVLLIAVAAVALARARARSRASAPVT